VWRLPSQHADIIERKLTSNSSENSVNSAAVSQDGKYLAYSDNTGIYLKLVRTGEVHAVPLPPNFSARVDDWFPDGSRLLVSRRDEPGKASQWSISVFGGSARLLADDALVGAVSPDGAHIAFRRAELNYYDGLLGREIWVMRSDGTDQIKIDKSWSMGTPTWSPDGKRIAYGSETEFGSPKISIEVNDWQNTRAETVFSDSHLTPVLHWLPDGRLIYTLAAGENGFLDSSLWTISLQQSGKISRPSKRLTPGNGWITQINGTADGKTLTFLRENRAPTAFIATLAPDGTTFITHKRLTLDDSLSFPTSWTTDSKAVLFSSNRNGTSEIFKQALDKPLVETLVSSAEQLTIPRLTPDGSEILYISTPKSAAPETPSSIFAIPIAGGPPRFILKDVNIWNLQCARLPSTVCMYAINKGNAVETYRFTVSGGKSTAPPQIDPPGNWSLSPDGSQRAIIPLGIEEGTIQLRPTGSGKIRTLVIKGWNELTNIDWSADGKSLLVSWHSAGKENALLKVTPDGKVSVLVRSNCYVGYAIPSPDGDCLPHRKTTPPRMSGR
jgi:Tol biopolymer transport system component